MRQLTKRESHKLGNSAKQLRRKIEKMLDKTNAIDGDKFLGMYGKDLREIDRLVELIHEDGGILMTRGDIDDYLKEERERQALYDN